VTIDLFHDAGFDVERKINKINDDCDKWPMRICVTVQTKTTKISGKREFMRLYIL